MNSKENNFMRALQDLTIKHAVMPSEMIRILAEYFQEEKGDNAQKAAGYLFAAADCISPLEPHTEEPSILGGGSKGITH